MKKCVRDRCAIEGSLGTRGGARRRDRGSLLAGPPQRRPAVDRPPPVRPSNGSPNRARVARGAGSSWRRNRPARTPRPRPPTPTPAFPRAAPPLRAADLRAGAPVSVTVRESLSLPGHLRDRHQHPADHPRSGRLLQEPAARADLFSRPSARPSPSRRAFRHLSPRDGPPHRVHRARLVPRAWARARPGPDAQPPLLAHPGRAERALGRPPRRGRS